MTFDHAASFLAITRPLLRRREWAYLFATVNDNWSFDQLAGFLRDDDPDVIAAACACIGLTAPIDAGDRLVPLLRHANVRIVTACEQALWQLWMRAGSEEAIGRLAAAVTHIRNEEYRQAASGLLELIDDEPDYAEAHHQLAIAHHCMEQLANAGSAYLAAAGLNRHHYPAFCGLGHIAVERGDLAEALAHYRAALRIHPQLAEVRRAADELEVVLAARSVA